VEYQHLYRGLESTSYVNGRKVANIEAELDAPERSDGSSLYVCTSLVNQSGTNPVEPQILHGFISPFGKITRVLNLSRLKIGSSR